MSIPISPKILPPPPPPILPPLRPNYNEQLKFRPQTLGNDYLPPAKEELSTLCKNMWITLSGLHDVSLLAVYKQVKPVLQDGPKCGLVALQMAQVLCKASEEDVVTVETLLNEAKTFGFTTAGEMFSTHYLQILAERVAGCTGEILSWSNRRLLSHLVEGKPVLVCYDADANHEPCMRNGHSAHWAVLTGFVIVLDNSFTFDNFALDCDHSLEHLFHYNDSQSRLNQLLNAINVESGAEIFVAARHGKSRYLALWPLTSLEASNKNLRELSPKHSEDNFVIPQGGLFEGLNNKMLLLH